MNKIEVNPRLFITCRLCLEDQGLYQIVPAVKEQISYCFDIRVEPFDGLPQLICKKCEAILSNYSEIKKKFIEKQNDLRSKLQGSNNVQVSRAQTQPEVSIKNLKFDSKNQNRCVPRKRKGNISSSSTELEYADPLKESRSIKEKYRNDEKPELWPASYKKYIVCRICDSRWFNIRSLKNHFNTTHSALNKKYSYIFNRHCEVKLHKTDGKHNITSSSSKVMHRKERIIKNVTSKYYIMYTVKDYKPNDDTLHNDELWNINSEKTVKSKGFESSDSSEADIVFKRKRIRRIYSRSSNDTVVLDTANKSNMSDNEKESQKSEVVKTPVELGECINIDDSSDSESENGRNAIKTMTEKQISDEVANQAVINDVINACQNKYIKKHQLDNFFLKANKNPADIALQLKRKILSIGRKIINKKIGVNCTPLLRFMEHKNLDIAWLPREIIYVSSESNYIRIMTRMKNFGENCDNETGWTDFGPTQTYEYSVVPNPNVAEISRSEPNYMLNGIDISEVSCVSVPQMTVAENAELISDAIIGTDTKKLLNANPVANPKQLPKKIVTKPVVPNIEVTLPENNDREYYMPIITSTTSLAASFSVENDAHNHKPETTSSKNDDQKSEAPRIKVKPVSELMSVETLSRMHEPMRTPCIVSTDQLISVQNENVVNIYVPQINPAPNFQNTLQHNVTMNSIAPEPAWQNEFMILDTTELPNTKTNSPFMYLKKLLLLHNIILLDTDVDLSKEFNCLIKFKVLYKQENKNQPVILCLAMFCLKNVFCLKVKDRNQDNLNLKKISPNWQWEVLKIYRGEVVNKILTNAQKISNEVYEFTNSFLCLLKSINLIKYHENNTVAMTV